LLPIANGHAHDGLRAVTADIGDCARAGGREGRAMSVEAVQRPDRIAQGIGLVLVSVTAMAFADALVKRVSADLTVWQVFATRSTISVLVLAALAYATGLGFRLRAPGWSMLRSAFLVLCWITFYASLPVLKLSVAAVAVYTNPIMTALLSAVLIGEPVTRRQRLGVLLGFVGVVAILKPGTDDFSWFVILPLLAGGFYSLAVILTRSKCQDEAPLSLALALHALFAVTGIAATLLLAAIGLGAGTKAAYPFLVGDWMPMGRATWGLMIFLGVLSAAYFAGVARAYQIAPPSIIATFDYGYLVSAAIWGFVFFAETPSALTVVGMVLITIAGLLVAIRR
jgi:drug/metabolite transporter (DMT)-like permease